ncbi:MAG: heavy-metal-associated domain-containing protein [Saprospiraceae bacterium]|nr:heavy-metal-associated domain-containing protein [Saprospiraceae bacterium]
MQNTVFIQNLKCGGCATSIINSLSTLQGINNVKVDNETDSVAFDSETPEQLELVKTTLEKLGYPAITDPNTLLLKAKSFVSCAIGRVDNMVK